MEFNRMGNRHIKHVNQRADFKRLPHVRIELYTVSDDEGNVWRRGRWRHWYVNPMPGSYAYGRRHDKTLKKTPSENRTAQAFAAALFGSEDSGADPSMRTASLSKAL